MGLRYYLQRGIGAKGRVYHLRYPEQAAPPQHFIVDFPLVKIAQAKGVMSYQAFKPPF